VEVGIELGWLAVVDRDLYLTADAMRPISVRNMPVVFEDQHVEDGSVETSVGCRAVSRL
jgi:hypothetical protein